MRLLSWDVASLIVQGFLKGGWDGSFSSVKLPKKGWASERESPIEYLLEAQPYSLQPSCNEFSIVPMKSLIIPI